MPQQQRHGCCGALEVWQWIFGSRTVWLVNKSAGQPQFGKRLWVVAQQSSFSSSEQTSEDEAEGLMSFLFSCLAQPRLWQQQARHRSRQRSRSRKAKRSRRRSRSSTLCAGAAHHGSISISHSTNTLVPTSANTDRQDGGIKDGHQQQNGTIAE
jgi:hypothetical protein